MNSVDVSVESDGKGRAIGFSVASSPLPGWPWLGDLNKRMDYLTVRDQRDFSETFLLGL